MATNTPALRGKVYSQFKNQTEFCQALGWNKNKVNALMNGRLALDQPEMEQIAKTLKITSSDEFLFIFFPDMSPMGTQAV